MEASPVKRQIDIRAQAFPKDDMEASPVKRQIDIRAQAFPKDDMEDRELVKLFEKRDDCAAELDAPGNYSIQSD